MINSISIDNITDNLLNTFAKSKSILFLLFITIVLTLGISIYYTIDIPKDIPIDTHTDIDWKKPPCNPDDLSKDWKEVTDPRMIERSNRRIFQYKNTNIKIAFEKGKPGLTGDKAKDHWHRYNPNFKNDRDLYLDFLGTPTGKGSNSSHIDPNCK